MEQRTDAEWFATVELLRAPEASRFVDHVRHRAPARLGGLLDAAGTTHFSYGGQLLMVHIRAMPILGVRSTVQVLWDGAVLAGMRDDGHLWDGFDARKDEVLHAQGLVLTDEEAAELAVEWIGRQLERPLEHKVWVVSDRVVAERWVLTDTGFELGRRGRRSARRRPPTSSTLLAPPFE